MTDAASENLTPGSHENWEVLHTGLAADHLVALGHVAYWSARVDSTLPLLAAALIRTSSKSFTAKEAQVQGMTFTAIFEKTSELIGELAVDDQVRRMFAQDADAIFAAMQDRNHLLHAYWLRGPREPAIARRTRKNGTTRTEFTAADVEQIAVRLATLSDRLWLTYAVADGILHPLEIDVDGI
ncbi:hypothetical protein [Curtobacterium flaccumfaciens]|uniref:hypothetical protein n=1 Tax=Curtobacterium flaccumfaciens TaxID=2035 RepID=UPI001BDF4B10|nr:hypothetical protein [Curtobacterium flaccumfaciens]MBT1673410.1 hypothetical protein [Curtobacterium flaccumfaciens pv. flaccumfaciens]